jgi:hypothetical protein
MAVGQTTFLLIDTPPSRASSLPHFFCALLNEMVASGYLPQADYSSWNLAAFSGVNLNASHVIR